LGGSDVVLVRSVDLARRLALRAIDCGAGTRVGVAPNASRDLVEAIKRSQATPHFMSINADSNYECPTEHLDLIWSQPAAGLPLPKEVGNLPHWVDRASSLPNLDTAVTRPQLALYGLHFSRNSKQNGALLVVDDLRLAERLRAMRSHAEAGEPSAALAQLRRLAGTDGLSAAQGRRLATVTDGIMGAAGLPLFASPSDALAHGVAVQVPLPGDVATMLAYIRGEHTPIAWLPELQPLHYAAVRPQPGYDPAMSAAAINRWLVVPVGPFDSDEELVHAVLGVAKAADYLGLRWATDPQRAQWYGDLMVEWYGPEHDAYRPLFAATLAPRR
jgi:hypothetical protein